MNAMQLIETPNLDEVEKKMFACIQPPTFLKHHFDLAGRIYIREIWMPACSIILGHRHRTGHFNIVTQGRALVRMNGFTGEIFAPFVGLSDPGTRKALYILEDMVWLTVHDNPDNEQDVAVLEDRYIIKSDAWTENEQQKEARHFATTFNLPA